MGLPTDSTIRSIQGLLAYKEDYVRQVFGNTHTVRRKANTSPVRVRIGIVGNGVIPNYRVEILNAEGHVEGLPVTFRGDNHNPLFEDNNGLYENQWSTATMSYEDVRDLLGEIRNKA